ncbi:PD-(D/E)XK nuclease family protein [Paenibacillus aceris]|uniref:PD-(D/E)XK nuclease family protein n=1 Tax=Paenibacillus aceris TaxID=869555 RepID=A0ABS4I9L8_9BACL|nr:PD-(D/E)XK nuclease family protein [Paenibacillus aceris]MBP1967632.1 hypothetical protein [Paenibacillus aceris]NHW37501.1 PD-(D/E)XK nuclease family protein [Paenibacillus aceris]
MDDHIAAIEKFLMDIEVLDPLEARLAEFNVFQTLNIHQTEIRHSNVLGWLFNPTENHGLGDTFLKKFIQTIYFNNKATLSNVELSMLELTMMNYFDFEVRREWNNIDIMLLSEENQFILVIENKVLSKESDQQLNKYKSIIDTHYSNYQKVYLFLTPDGDPPSDEENWISIDYELMYSTLLNSLRLKSGVINERVRQFLDQYIEILRRYFVGEKDIEKICREIYYKHQKALDLIFDFKPDIYLDIKNYLSELLYERSDVIIDTLSKTYIRFITREIDNIIPREGTGWTRSNRILLVEIQNRNDKLILKIIIGPGNHMSRIKLFEISEKQSNLFKGRLKKFSDKFTQIYSTEILPKNYMDQYDFEWIKAKIKKEYNDFMANDYEKISKAIAEDF